MQIFAAESRQGRTTSQLRAPRENAVDVNCGKAHPRWPTVSIQYTIQGGMMHCFDTHYPGCEVR